MAFGKALVVCSEFHGVLTNQAGEPQAGVSLTRQWRWGWKDETGEQTTTSAADGSFSFPAVERKSLTASLLPHEPTMSQEITAQLGSGPLSIWYAGKQDYAANSELGRPLDMVCYTDREVAMTDRYSGTCVERAVLSKEP